jgi:hypothetical protein
VTLSITTRGDDPVEFVEIDPTTGNEKPIGKKQSGTWPATLAPGVYGFGTTEGFAFDNPLPLYVTFALASGKDPWPPPPPPPRAWSVAPSTFYGWYSQFLLDEGNPAGVGFQITVEPLAGVSKKGH